MTGPFSENILPLVGDSRPGTSSKQSGCGLSGIRSLEPQDNNVAYVHLPFLQQSSRIGLGTVTQFNVRVDDPSKLDAVAAAIDALFKSDQAPTSTKPEKAFFAQTAKDMIEMVSFTRWLGFGAVAAVLALVANALLLCLHIKENAIFQTVGFPGLRSAALGRHIADFRHAGWPFKPVSSTQRFNFGNEGTDLACA